MKNPRYYPFERNRYFYGKLLTVRDFESEQKYFNDKRRLVNRLLFGSGVVCGLQVVAIDDQTISVEAGVALDCSGREIVVSSPVTQKLSMIDGFLNNEYAKNVYLCIAYDENGKEPVHSVAGASTSSEEVSEYNRIQESYKIFVKEEAPDPSSIGLTDLVEDNRLIYQDSQVRIRQKTPRYVNPGEDLEITLIVEKTLQTPQIQVEYQVESEHFYPEQGGVLNISFTEPEYGQKTEYSASFQVKAGDYSDIIGRIAVKDRRVNLRIGDKQLDIETDCSNEVHIVEGSIKERVLRSYFDLPLEQCLQCAGEQCIYLAKISLLHMGRTYIIERVENVPFGEYVYNASVLYRLGLLETDRYGADFSSKLAATLLDEDLRDNQLNVQPDTVREQPKVLDINTGVAVIDLESNAKAGRSYFSEEIDHGLGFGPVLIVTGLEEHDNMLLGVEQYKEQIFYGASEVFQKSSFESTLPPVSIGTVAFPGTGTFRVGVRLQAGSKVTKIPVRWWAYRRP
ncbi:hypothetical protein DCCM_3936 [Desulfocucumis palustris]|uniref:Uncharacterized protein n=1 Tax=Desulfocucumis palustris TaxID=1898651 RepID=A0A2L2XKK7_9FIRM|nr:hypothetical protein [Desulfocucumis palustris]GBF34816.1 hypothetical protein DCCM_3936 [Desulfocucumis palustris]